MHSDTVNLNYVGNAKHSENSIYYVEYSLSAKLF